MVCCCTISRCNHPHPRLLYIPAEFMIKLGIPQEDVVEMCAALYAKYGTTLSGLVVRMLLRLCHCTILVPQHLLALKVA